MCVMWENRTKPLNMGTAAQPCDMHTKRNKTTHALNLDLQKLRQLNIGFMLSYSVQGLTACVILITVL